MELNPGKIDPLSPIPDSERRSPLVMGLVWITMITSFPTVLIGFEWFKQGFSLSQVAISTLVSCLLLLAYTIPATQLGAITGLGYCALARSVFGRWGTGLVTANLIGLMMIWYGFTAVWMAHAVIDLFHVQFSIVWLSVIFAFFMAFNNFFGFTGVANFARFFAAPVLVAWVAYTFVKALSAAPPTVLSQSPPESTMHALTAISSFVIGFAVWGNEPDYWRYSKPGILRSAIPLGIALLIGEVTFPIAGWLVARVSGVTGSAAATAFMNNYGFAGVAVIGVLCLAACYFAANDSNLFAAGTAVESVWPMKHKTTITILAVVGALIAAGFSVFDTARTMNFMASLSCIVMPAPMVVILTEWYLRQRVFGLPMNLVPDFSELPTIHWPAAIAWLSGIIVGLATSGVIPAFAALHVGISPVQAWLTIVVVYAFLRRRQYAEESARRQLFAQAHPQPAESLSSTARD
jgi:purine-cytosine permease-like protein